MGTWGTRVYDNDAAANWVHKFIDQGFPLLDGTLEKVMCSEPKSISINDSQEALAACEIIARMNGAFGSRSVFKEELDRLVKENKSVITCELVQKAIEVVDRILSNQSEMHHAWRSDGHRLTWVKNIKYLREQIHS